MSNDPTPDDYKPIDQMTRDEVDALAADTLNTIAQLSMRWRGLVALTDDQRKNHHGMHLTRLIPALEPLFTAMLPDATDAKEKAEDRAAFATSFDIYGDKDGGVDPDHFEADLLGRRIHRIKAQQGVAAALGKLERLMSDDVLHTSETVLVPSQLALNLIHGYATTKFAKFLTPVYNALSAMTSAARARTEELALEKKAAAAQKKADAVAQKAADLAAKAAADAEALAKALAKMPMK